MPIKFDISLSAGGRFRPVSSHTLHDKRITVGRDQDCTISLEDTQKHVSRRHAEIEQDQDCYWIKVVSKVNPIAVNGKSYSYGERVPVVEGDQVSVGLYKLEIIEADIAPPPPKARPAPPVVDETEETTIAPRPVARAPAAPPPQVAPAAPASDPEEVTFPPAAKAPAPAAKAPAAPALPANAAEQEEATYVPSVKASPPPSPPPQASSPMASKLPDSAILDDEVTYIPPMWARPSGNRNSAAQLGSAPAAEDLTGIGHGSTDDTHPPAFQAEAPKSTPESAPVPATGLDFDLSDAFADAPEAKAPAPSAPEPEPEVEEDFSEDLTYVRRPPPKPVPAAIQPSSAPAPVAVAPKPAEVPKPAQEKAPYRSPLDEIQARIAARAGNSKAKPAPPAADASPDRAVTAFLDGAGLSHLRVTDPEAFMRASGAMVRAAVGGVLTLLADRAAARQELGLEADAGAGDNPVTSMSSPDEVIAFLFDPKRPAIGNADPTVAFSDACADLRSHQAALVAAMRAAAMTALLKIDPKKIERENSSGLGVLNITRKSRLWELSVALHEQFARDIEQNFSSVFSAEILAAFAEHARKARDV